MDNTPGSRRVRRLWSNIPPDDVTSVSISRPSTSSPPAPLSVRRRFRRAADVAHSGVGFIFTNCRRKRRSYSRPLIASSSGASRSLRRRVDDASETSSEASSGSVHAGALRLLGLGGREAGGARDAGSGSTSSLSASFDASLCASSSSTSSESRDRSALTSTTSSSVECGNSGAPTSTKKSFRNGRVLDRLLWNKSPARTHIRIKQTFQLCRVHLDIVVRLRSVLFAHSRSLSSCHGRLTK